MNLSSSENLQKKRERESEQLTDINIDLTNENEKKVDDPEDYCKVYENKEYKHLFFGGIWKLEILNNYFNFPFQLQKVHKESRTNIPICLVLKYADDSSLYFYIQIEDEESFPQEMTYSNTISTNENTNQDEYKNNNDYVVVVNFCFTGYNYSKFTFGTNSGSGKWVKTNIPNDILNSVKNQNSLEKWKVLIELSIEKTNRTLIESNPMFCGLINEGTTCYMNSLLQLLFMIKYFKKAIFNMKIKKNSYQTSKIYSIQKLFYEMMKKDRPKAVSTTHLITSFGWNEEQVRVQRDIQEFFIVLSEIIEKEISTLKEKNTFKYLFEGKVTSKIKCINVNFESSKEETFTDIQLPVKNCNNLIEAFNKYTEVEVLNGKEQYQTEKYGKQDAKKDLLFSSLPKILVLQLNRFRYSPEKNEMEKINDRFEFSNELNLEKYTLNYGNIYPEYECIGVVVHVGGIDGGHYFSFIKHINDKKESVWYKFNDSVVSIAEPYEVFENNFGGKTTYYRRVNDGEVGNYESTNYQSAYLLIYIRKDCISELLGDYSIDEIPQETLSLFEYEQRQLEKEQLTAYRKESFVNVNIITKEILEQKKSMGMIENYYSKDNNMNRLRLNMHKESTIGNIVDLISEQTGICKKNLFVYKFSMNKRFSYIDRFDYNSQYISREMYKTKLSLLFTIEDNKKNMNSRTPFEDQKDTDEIYFYIHCDINQNILVRNNKMNDISRQDSSSEDDEPRKEEIYEIVTNIQKGKEIEKYNNCVYFNIENNYWCFNQKVSNNRIDNGYLSEDKHYVLIILKYPSIEYIPLINSLDIVLKLYKILQIEISERISEKLSKFEIKSSLERLYEDNRYNKAIIPNLANSDIQYLIEYASLEKYFKTTSSLSEFKSNFVVKANQNLELYKNDILNVIINVNFKNKIDLLNLQVDSFRPLIDNKYNNIFLKVKSNIVNKERQLNMNQENKRNEFDLVVSMQINDIKKQIVSLISEELIWKLFSNGNSFYKNIDYSYCDIENNKNFITDMINLFRGDYQKENLEIIELIKYQTDTQSVTLLTSFPLIQYINTLKNNQIEFTINLYKLITPPPGIVLKDYTIFEVILCDFYSNPLIKLYIPLSFHKGEQVMNKINEKITKYLNEKKSTYNYYPDSNVDFFFVLHNPKTLIVYDIENAKSIKKLDDFSQIQLKEFRYQPYLYSLCIIPDNKIFICVYEKDTPICFPFVLHFDLKKTTINTFKTELILYLLKNNEIKRKFVNCDLDASEYRNKFRFYQCRLEKMKPAHQKYIGPQLDDSTLASIKSVSPFNIKIEVIGDYKENKQTELKRNSMGIIES